MTAKSKTKGRPKTSKDRALNDSNETRLIELHKNISLHSGQIVPCTHIFENKKRFVFLQCGRNWGKTTFIVYAAVRYALTHPGSLCYIVYPTKEQGREVIWSSNVLKNMIPNQYIAATRGFQEALLKQELRIVLTNDSFVKILSADDPRSLRGIKPDFCAFDEFRDFKEKVYSSHMEANLVAKKATLLIGSTPPDIEGPYTELRSDFMHEIARRNDAYLYMELPTSTNPHIDKEDLAAIKRRLVSHGELRVWEREYEAKFIPGGASSIFPMFAEKREDLVYAHGLVKQLMREHGDDLEFFAMFDPATSSVFAVLLGALNRKTGQVYLFDEIYEQDRKRTSSVDIWKRTAELKLPYCAKKALWENVYDEHEAWFQRDLERYDVLERDESMQPTSKQSRDKQEDLSIIKDLMLSDKKLFISERCRNLIKEIENYVTDDQGRFIKKRDHQIDNFRYFLAASGFSLNEEPDVRGYLDKIGQGKNLPPGFSTWFDEREKERDWTTAIDERTVFEDSIYLEDMDYDGLLGH